MKKCIILADFPILLTGLHCFVIDQPRANNKKFSPFFCQHSNSHFTAETRVLLLLTSSFGTILSFETVGPRQWLTEWPQSDWLPTLRPKIRELGSKDDKSKWADVAVWWWWWRLMCLEAAYEEDAESLHHLQQYHKEILWKTKGCHRRTEKVRPAR